MRADEDGEGRSPLRAAKSSPGAKRRRADEGRRGRCSTKDCKLTASDSFASTAFTSSSSLNFDDG